MAGNDADHRSGDLLAGAEAHIWLVRLDEVGQNWPGWEKVLAPDELARANRFLEPADRFRSAASRAVLRRFLGYYLDLPPARFQFVHNRFGKPALAEADRAARLNFSVAHSHEHALFGFAAGRPIGVDIEWMRADMQFQDLANGICSPAEIRKLESLPEGPRLQALYECWVLKEAYLKALGVGLSFAPQRVGIVFDDRMTAAIPGSRCLLGVRGRWTTLPIDDVTGYAAIAVVPGGSVAFRRFVLADDWI
jgi:4'-phosphopantetheinyl transferase